MNPQSLELRLIALCDALEARKVGYAFSGGLALAAHGKPSRMYCPELIAAASTEMVASAVGEAGLQADPEEDFLFTDPAIPLSTIRILPLDASTKAAWQNRAARRWRGRIVHVVDPVLAEPLVWQGRRGAGRPDMSDAAISTRFRIASQLRNVGLGAAASTPA